MDLTPKTIVKRIEIQRMRRYSGEGNIHSDDEAGKEMGLGGAIVQGGQLAGYLNEMMIRTLGEGFLDGGEIAVTFVKAARSGDVLRSGGTLTSDTMLPEGRRVAYDVWLENDRGEKVTVGKASGWAPKA